MDISTLIMSVFGILIVSSLFYFLGWLLGRLWYLVAILPALTLVISVIVLLSAISSNECDRAIDESICGIGLGIQFVFGYVAAIVSLLCLIVGPIISFIGSRKKRNQPLFKSNT